MLGHNLEGGYRVRVFKARSKTSTQDEKFHSLSTEMS